MLKEKGFWKGFVACLGLVTAFYATQAVAKGQGVVIDRREAVALEAIATQLIAIREDGIKLQIDRSQPIPVEMRQAAGTKLEVKLDEAIKVRNDFGTQLEVKQVTSRR